MTRQTDQYDNSHEAESVGLTHCSHVQRKIVFSPIRLTPANGFLIHDVHGEVQARNKNEEMLGRWVNRLKSASRVVAGDDDEGKEEIKMKERNSLFQRVYECNSRHNTDGIRIWARW